MQLVRKIEIKRMYLEDTGCHPPEFRRYFRRYYTIRGYRTHVTSYEEEPDFIAMQDYIEWLENKVIENAKLETNT